MRKFYVTYLLVMSVLCMVALLSLTRMVNKAKSDAAQPEASATTIERSVVSVENAVSRKQAELAANERIRQDRESREQAARIKAAVDAEAARINREIAMKPKPAPVIGWAPSGIVRGRVFTNADLLPAPAAPKRAPERGDGYVIVDFKPSNSGALEWRDAVRSGRCAAFSFRNANRVTVNRLYCDPVVAR